MLKRIIKFSLRNIPIHLIMLLTSLLPNVGFTTRIRGFLLRPFLGKCRKGLKVASGVIINKPGNLEIGENVYLAHNVWINAVGGLKLSDEVIISPFCVVDTSKHVFKNGAVTHTGVNNSIEVGRGSWIASHVVVTDGVKIGDGVLVASGAVVTKNVPSDTMVAGVPARPLKNKT